MRLLPEMPQEDLHAAVRSSFALVNSSVSEGMSAAILEVLWASSRSSGPLEQSRHSWHLAPGSWPLALALTFSLSLSLYACVSMCVCLLALHAHPRLAQAAVLLCKRRCAFPPRGSPGSSLCLLRVSKSSGNSRTTSGPGLNGDGSGSFQNLLTSRSR